VAGRLVPALAIQVTQELIVVVGGHGAPFAAAVSAYGRTPRRPAAVTVVKEPHNQIDQCGEGEHDEYEPEHGSRVVPVS